MSSHGSESETTAERTTGGTPGAKGRSQGTTREASSVPAKPRARVARYLVADRATKVVTLRAPAPRGKLSVSLSFPVKNRNVVIPESAAKKFAAHISELVASGVLLVPAPADPELKPVRTNRKDG